jgi:hypothetical protein
MTTNEQTSGDTPKGESITMLTQAMVANIEAFKARDIEAVMHTSSHVNAEAGLLSLIVAADEFKQFLIDAVKMPEPTANLLRVAFLNKCGQETKDIVELVMLNVEAQTLL